VAGEGEWDVGVVVAMTMPVVISKPESASQNDDVLLTFFEVVMKYTLLVMC
jgi:hypothetical protein